MSIPKKILNVKRFTVGSYDDYGVYQDPPVSVLTISASVQPLSGEDIKLLPEGRRSSTSYCLFTSTELLTVKTSECKNADIVEIYGSEFEVIAVKKWGNNIINHYKVIVA